MRFLFLMRPPSAATISCHVAGRVLMSACTTSGLFSSAHTFLKAAQSLEPLFIRGSVMNLVLMVPSALPWACSIACRT